MQRGVHAFLSDADSILLPRHVWPPKASSAKVHCDGDEWDKICSGLLKYNLCELIDEVCCFSWGGAYLLNGMFGVLKNEQTDSGIEILRLIMNLIPLNSISLLAQGDIEMLPMLTQLTGLQ